MYNANKPSAQDLPSTGQLLKSTFIAIGIAAVILVTAILPGEYGIDPTGAGRLLGLTQMGDIKNQLAEEETASQHVAAVAPLAPVQAPEVTIVQPEPPVATTLHDPSGAVEPAVEQAAAALPVNEEVVVVVEPLRNDVMTVMLTPGQGAEVKLEILKGKTVKFHWSGNGGKVNYDTHGDPYDAPRDFYHGYGKGRGVLGDEGELTAAFDGKHGWFWRNRSKQNVTVTLRVEGDYIAIKRVI